MARARAEQTLVWSARSMGANRLRMLWDVVLPSAMPELLNGIRTALALTFILLVSSELIVAREGLGYLIGFLGANGSYDAMYAVVLTVAFLGFAADRGYQMLMNRMLQWREQTAVIADPMATLEAPAPSASAHLVLGLRAGVLDCRADRGVGGSGAERRVHAVRAAVAFFGDRRGSGPTPCRANCSSTPA